MRSPSLSQLVLTKLMVRQWNIGAASLCRRFFASSSDSGQIDRPANSGLERYPDGGPPRLLDREPIGSTAVSKAKRISRAMRAYLEKAKADKEFLEKELEEYNLGKRHLANMMGLNAAEMTQTDIDKAIEYLLPSGLTNLAAKPIMKHPKEVFPTPRAAQFGEDGRPHHFLFYTARPSFYQILFPVGSCRRALCTSAARVHKIRVAIIGAGPAGFYVASSLLKGLPNAHVSVYEKLPVPYGLIRYGVAPDHPEVKNCIHQFEKTVADFDARFAFFGNVQVGKDLEIKEIIDAHHITVLAYGSEKEKQLGIPGADAAQTKNYFSARTFVGWYNGVPWNSSVLPDLSRVETVIVLGHGNVALDVARILLLPLHLLKQTDITEHALAVLSQSRVKRVELIGRRGPLQVAFTIKELRELINLPETVSRFASKDVAEIASPDLIKQLSRPRQRLTQLLVDTAIKPLATKKSSDEREWALKFLRTPVEILRSDDGFAKGVRFVINRLAPSLADCADPKAFEASAAIGTGEEETRECQLIVSSIGYQTVNLDPSGSIIPFNKARSNVQANADGQVEGLPHVFAVGWCARGPTGVLATTQSNASFVAKNIVRKVVDEKSIDVEDSRKTGHEAISALLSKRGVPFVSWSDWSKIDSLEKSRGSASGKPREKLVNVDEILKVVEGT